MFGLLMTIDQGQVDSYRIHVETTADQKFNQAIYVLASNPKSAELVFPL